MSKHPSLLLKNKSASSEEVKISKAQSSSSTQPSYIDSKGEIFTSARIVAEGFKPTGKIKGYSWSEVINSPDYGKVKRK